MDAMTTAASRPVRHFVTVGDRQVHYRRAGSGPPVAILHESPLSSRWYVWLAQRLAAAGFTAIALDTPGYGRSDPLAIEQPSIADYADALDDTLTALGIERCGLYGSHTGAAIALEHAVRHPQRAAAVVLDGILLPTEEERASLLAEYCLDLPPELDGSHLVKGWTMRRDQYVYWPWYRREQEAQLSLEMGDADELARGMLDWLRAGRGYHLGYHAAFRHDTVAALRAVQAPTAVVASPRDVLFEQLDRFPGDLPWNVTVGERPEEPDAAAHAVAGHMELVRSLDSAPAPVPSRPLSGRLTRGWARTPWGDLFLRSRDDAIGRPLVLVHGSPTSAQALEPLLAALAPSRPVYAFDTLGNGDSDKPDAVADPVFARPEIPDYARVLAAAIDDVGLEDFDLYGTHTGAAIAIELARLLGDRVGSVILDGVGMFDADTRAEFFERYFMDLTPRWDGTQILSAWLHVRDGGIWFPWYRRDPEHRYTRRIGDAEHLHDYVVELLKSGPTYPLAYAAAFRYDAAPGLAALRTRTLICSGPDDPLLPHVALAAAHCPEAVTVTPAPGDPAGAAALYERFLDGGDMRAASAAGD